MAPHTKDLDSVLTDDFSLPFQLETSALRGRLVRLGPTLDLILHQHAYPTKLGNLLGEAMVIAAALAGSLKYSGIFTLQVKSDGPVRLLVADVSSTGGIRAYAQQQNEASDKPLLGKGYLAFTVDQNAKTDRYQGIVELAGDSLAKAVQHYFRQSEQIPTGIIAAARRDEHGRWRGGCLMLQQMPRDGGIAHESDTSVEDDWYRAMMLMGTCTADELTSPTLSAEELLYRLFHEEGVRVFSQQPLFHQCRCSEERVNTMLQSLPETEIETMVVDGMVTVTCEFCNKSYGYDEAARRKLYSKQPQ